MDLNKAKTIKMIGTNRYLIEALELTTGEYCVSYATLETSDVSEPMLDLKTCLFLFDLKLQELDGV